MINLFKRCQLDPHWSIYRSFNERVNLRKFNFPGGEVHFEYDAGHNSMFKEAANFIVCDFQDKDDIMTLLLLADHINEDKELFMEYIPYSRQDRAFRLSSPFSLKTFCKLINSCGFKKVHIKDPHSDVTPALLDNCVVYNRENFMPHMVYQPGYVVVSPDAGAKKKNDMFCLRHDARHFLATKFRDTVTGKISGTKLHAYGWEIKGEDILVIDDICDGGKTFIELGKVIKDCEPKSLSLFVTYGLFSKGFEELNKYYDSIKYEFNLFEKELLA